MVLDQTLQLMVFGVVDLSGHFLMSEFSIHMPPLIRLSHRPVAIENMKTLKRENTNLEFGRLSELHSLQLSSLQQEAWVALPLPPTNALASLQMGHIIQSDNGVASLPSLLRSSIQCIRGARSNQGHAIHLPASIELTVRESLIPLV